MSREPVKPMPYMDEAWFFLLRAACEREGQRKVAARLGVSDSVVSQVMRATGAYGNGSASTRNLADRVVHKFGNFECPHLTEQYGEPRVISAAECRSYAHRATPPIGSPGLMQHWRACNTCPHKPLSAPPAPKVPKPRKRGADAAPAAAPAAVPVAAPAPAPEAGREANPLETLP